MTRARAIVLLRLTLVVATSYLLLAQDKFAVVGSAAAWVIVAALASNVAFLWLPRALVESTKFAMILVVVDTTWITAALISAERLQLDSFILYFFVLFLAAIAQDLALLTAGTVLVSGAYLYLVYATQGAEVAWSSATLIRIPFFFAAAAINGFFAE